MLKFKSLLGLTTLLSALVIVPEASAQSMGVDPLFLEVRPNQSAAVRVRNTSLDQIPVEVLIARREVNEAGEQTRVPADNDFIVFPPQAVVPSKGTQVFRVRPISDAVDTSQSYYISFKQVPTGVIDTGGGAQLNVAFIFDAAVHVVPRRAEAEMELLDTKLSTMTYEIETEDYEVNRFGRQERIKRMVTAPAIELNVRNTGNKYLYLSRQEYTAEVTYADGSTDEHVWVNDTVADYAKVTLLQPGKSRTFKLPLPEGTSPTAVSVTSKPRDEF